MNNTNPLYEYLGWTLVDITSTGALAHDNKSRNQQRNWEAVVQTLGLRAQVFMLTASGVMQYDLVNHGKMKFGSSYTGKHLVWMFKFGVEHPELYATSDSEVGGLFDDFSDIPVITGLSETVSIPSPVFVTRGNDTNIYFTKAAP